MIIQRFCFLKFTKPGDERHLQATRKASPSNALGPVAPAREKKHNGKAATNKMQLTHNMWLQAMAGRFSKKDLLFFRNFRSGQISDVTLRPPLLIAQTVSSHLKNKK